MPLRPSPEGDDDGGVSRTRAAGARAFRDIPRIDESTARAAEHAPRGPFRLLERRHASRRSSSVAARVGPRRAPRVIVITSS